MPEISKPTEKRLQPRYALTLTGSAEVLYRRSPGAGNEPGSGRFKIETVNVSAGGFLVGFDSEVSSTDVLMLYFNHPETKVELSVEVQIQWMRKNATGIMGKYVAGVALRKPEEQGVADLVEYAMKQDPTVL